MLSPKAIAMINDYLSLPFPGLEGVVCPYFNNSRANLRGQLRVLIGKGTPKEIVEEAQIISIQYHAGLFEKNGACCLHNEHTGEPVTPDDMRRFLIKHNLGIECSGFITNVLRAHFKETKGIDAVRKIFITSPKKIVRWTIAKLRPVENINVRTYADDKNTAPIKNIADSKPGDVIIMLETGPTKKRNHIVLIEENNGNVINYVHARAWSTEGQFGHGVNRGTITINSPTGALLEQTWNEKGLTGEANETYLEAKNASRLEIRRLKI